ncbi:MAG TPA: hypothetical protein VGL99_15535, partial [Chloroflexota bacterium]
MAVLSPPDLGADIGLEFPTMYSGQRVYGRGEVPELPLDELEQAVRQQLQPLIGRISRGGRVAITGGSRGIANIPAILRACG